MTLRLFWTWKVRKLDFQGFQQTPDGASSVRCWKYLLHTSPFLPCLSCRPLLAGAVTFVCPSFTSPPYHLILSLTAYYTLQCTLHTRPYTLQCTLHTTHSTLYMAYCQLDTSQSTQHIAHCILHTTDKILHTAYCILHTTVVTLVFNRMPYFHFCWGASFQNSFISLCPCVKILIVEIGGFVFFDEL